MITKFVLILHLCSYVTGNCFSDKVINIEYPDHYSCVRNGYIQSYKSLEALEVEDINENKTVVKFECKEIEIKQI
jgi:hypothetical protein|tara:strand:+ start:58 stop:282 length:225 start_codon:yes stop_codon:yes gene_type:complete